MSLIELLKQIAQKAERSVAGQEAGKQAADKVIERNRARRARKAEQLEKEAQEKRVKENKPDAQGKAPSHGESIQEKNKIELVNNGTPLSIEQKLQIIQSETTTVPAEKAKRLEQTFTNLQNEIRDNVQSPGSRDKIEGIIRNIPEDVYSDPDLAEIAREIRQTAYNHIMRNPAYMSGIDIKQRVAMAKTFNPETVGNQYRVKAIRVREDEEYLLSIKADISRHELTQEEVSKDRQVARELIDFAKTNAPGRLDDVEAVLLTVRQSELMDMSDAMIKIKNGPDWVKKAAEQVKGNEQAATMLAELSDAYRLDITSVDDAAYVYLKAAKLTSDTREVPLGERSEIVNGVQITKPEAGEPDAVNDAIDKAGKISHEINAVIKEKTIGIKGREQAVPAPPIGPYSDYHNDEAAILALPADTFEQREFRNFLLEVNKTLGQQSQVEKEVNQSRTNERQVRAYYDNVSDLAGVYISDFMGTTLDRPEYQQFRIKLIKLIQDGAYAIEQSNSRGWTDMYLLKRSMDRAHETPEIFLYKLVDQMRSVPSIFDNKVSQAFERYAQQVTGYIVSGDYAANRISYCMNHAARVTELSGVNFDTNDPNSHQWIKDVTVDSDYKRFKDRIQYITQDAESLKYTYNNLLGGRPLEQGRTPAANLGDDGYLRLYNGRNGVNAYIYGVISRQGWNVKWEDTFGHKRVIAGAALDDMVHQGANEIWAHRHLMDVPDPSDPTKTTSLFAQWAKRDMTQQDVEYAVREMVLLKASMGERAEQILNGLLPGEVFGDANTLINPEWFAGQLPDYKLMTALNFLRSTDFRWDMVEDVPAIEFRIMAWNEAARSGIDVDIKNRMKYVQPGDKEFIQLAKHYFNIVDDNPASEAAALKQLRIFRVGLAKPARIPESIKELSKQDLIGWMIFKEGLAVAAPRMPGGYTINSVGWHNQTIVRISNSPEFQALMKGPIKGSFSHERTRIVAGDLINAPTHGDIHTAVHKLKHRHKDISGIEVEGELVTLAKTDPLARALALEDVQDSSFIKYFQENAEHHLYDIYEDVIPATTYTENGVTITKGHDIKESDVKITSDRFDLFVKRTGMRHQLIDEGLARVGEGPQDYSKSLEDAKADSTKWKQIALVCKETHVDPEKYYTLMNNLSLRMQDKDMMDASATVKSMKYFLTVHYKDPRYRYMDDARLGNNRISILLGSADPSVASGAGRMYGDDHTAEDAYKDWHMAMYSADEKMFIQMAQQWASKTKWAGGRGYKETATEMMFYSWGLARLKDFPLDFLGLGGEGSLMKTSMAQRAGELGQLSLGLNEFDHLIHEGEKITNTNWHATTPHMAHMIELRSHLAFQLAAFPPFMKKLGEGVADKLPEKITIAWPKPIRALANATSKGLKIPTIADFFNKKKVIDVRKGVTNFFEGTLTQRLLPIYRYWALGLISAAILIAQGTENFKKGFSGQASGGGGGAPAHGH